MAVEFADLLYRMEDHDIIPTCLSAERHRPRDFLLHYLGCEQFFQREDYLASLSPEQAKQVNTRLQRIQYLRSVLENDLGEGRQLVQNLTSSLASWRTTKDFQEGIGRVRELRKMHFADNGLSQREVHASGRYQDYNPDLDTHAYLIRFKDGRISIHDLIQGSEEDSALIPPKGTINYFHFPANNMLWAERAIKRYYKQKSGLASMPYPHWDTARHQAKISDAVQKEEEKYKRDKIMNEQRLRGMRRVRQRGLQLLNAQSRQPGSEWRLENRDLEKTRAIAPRPPKRTATGAFANIMKRQGRFRRLPLWSVFSTDGTGRVVAGTEIGQVLFDAAVLYEAMSTYREKSLIRKYLHADPPLHPRRTLEQTNAWTLSLSWHASARDQVVHRATRPKQLDFHSVDPSTKEWRDRIRKLPRVMMIDQLWMWILDDQTVFTCFPDHGDLSHHNHLPGIHSRIRDAILKNGKGSPQDGILLVMQLFRQAIRDVATKHSFGAEQYWEWARIFSRLAHTDVDNGLSDLIVPFLDIGKEGELQVPISLSIVAITYYLAFGNPWRVSRDIFRWAYMKCGMYQIFAPRDLTLSSLRDRYKDRSKRKEAEQAWVRRRSAQMAKDNQERRAAQRLPAMVHVATQPSASEAISPDTPVMTPVTSDEPSTGMFAVYQELTNSPLKMRTPNS
ncbi:hypothetical protein SLS64_008650 [Diaporthe eres]